MNNRSKSWSWRHAILDSGLPPTTRHVLLTISCLMNDVGEGCYRTTREIAEWCDLSERAVCEHIQKVCDAGWIIKNKHGFRGQKWKTNDYKAAWPDDDIAPENDQKNDGKMDIGTDPRSVPSDTKALTLTTERH